MRRYPADIPTAYEADWGQEWTHLFLTYVMQARTPAFSSWHLVNYLAEPFIASYESNYLYLALQCPDPIGTCRDA